MLHEICQIPKAAFYRIPFMWQFVKDKTEKNKGTQGLKEVRVNSTQEDSTAKLGEIAELLSTLKADVFVIRLYTFVKK
jgi:hypothetical protein